MHCPRLSLEFFFNKYKCTVKVCDWNYCSACVCNSLSKFVIGIIVLHVFATHCQRFSLELLVQMCLRCTVKDCH